MQNLKKKTQNPLNTISIVCFLQTCLFTEKFSRTGTIHLGIFRGRAPSIRTFSAYGHYLNNRVFLLRNYRLILAPRKFDVLKTNMLGKYASFKNIKFPRDHYQTDCSET